MNRPKTVSSQIKLYVYILLIMGGTALTVISIFFGEWIFLSLSVPTLILSILLLVHTYRDTLHKVTFMFNSIECDDYTFKFSENIKSPDSIMFNTSLNRIKEIMANAKVRALEREKYYELIMNSAKTGVITINDNGNVFQANAETMRLFGLSIFTHINQLRIIDPQLTELLKNIKSGERRQISIRNERGESQLALSASDILYDNKKLKIVTVNDINSELSDKEIESWIKLTRILTHEVMNSLAPITSLSDTLIHIVEDRESDIAKGLETISASGKSLISFVESYRKFTRIQAPVCTAFEIKPFLERIISLVSSEPELADIYSGTEDGKTDSRSPRVSLRVEPDDILIYADQDLVNQVIVNLLKNALQAARAGTSPGTAPQVDIYVRIAENGNVIIQVSNTGGAIPQEIAEDIFLPFFTTKTNGSGVGLSIAKQIMLLHGGSIALTCNTDKQITFTLTFK